MIHRLLRASEVNVRGECPTISDEKLLFLGGLMGLTPSFRGGNGQRLADAAQALQPEHVAPDFAADAEFIERELFVPENI